MMRYKQVVQPIAMVTISAQEYNSMRASIDFLMKDRNLRVARLNRAL